MVNFLFHTLNAYLVFKITRDYFDDVKILKLFTSLFYLLHPVQVESVVWISSLRGLSATSFALLFLLSFLKGRRIAYVYFLLGLLCKPTMIAIFPYGILLSFIKNKVLPKKSKELLIIGSALALVFFYIHKSDVLSTHFDSIDSLLRFKLTLSSVSLYLINLLFPFRLSFDYQINPFTISYLEEIRQLTPLLLLSPCFILGLSGLLLKKEYKERALLGLGFLILLTPHIGLVLHDFNNISVVSDRYLNLPLFAFALFLGKIFVGFISYFKARFDKLSPLIHFYFVLLLLAPLSFYQTLKWNDPVELLGQSNRFMSVREAILLGIANQYQNKGDIRNARANLKNALAANPNSHEALSALLEVNEKNPDPREENYIINHVQNPFFNMTTEFYIPLIKLYMKRSFYHEAKELIDYAIINKVDLKEAYLLKGQLEETRRNDVLLSYRKLEIHFKLKGNFKEALFYCEKFLKLKPFDENALERKNNYLEKLD